MSPLLSAYRSHMLCAAEEEGAQAVRPKLLYFVYPGVPFVVHALYALLPVDAVIVRTDA